jgi:ABC-type nitrate/sulfonate/bicarbonate transport system permease component
MSAVEPIGTVALTRAAARTGESRGAISRRVGLRALTTILGAIVSLAAVAGVWQLAVKGLHLDPFVARDPGDVWRYLTGADSAAHRTIVFDAAKITVYDAGLGFFVGTGAAVAVAVAFTLSRGTERTFMPIAMALRSVPLVAMTPLIALVFGRGDAGVTVIAGIVTFFPTLVNVGLALRSVPASSVDLMRAYGAQPKHTLLKVQVPSALPALFASARIAAPLAVTGALLAEFLVTGKGLGYLMLQAVSTFESDQMWSGVALITIFSVVFYGIISAMEQLVLARFAPDTL